MILYNTNIVILYNNYYSYLEMVRPIGLYNIDNVWMGFKKFTLRQRTNYVKYKIVYLFVIIWFYSLKSYFHVQKLFRHLTV